MMEFIEDNFKYIALIFLVAGLVLSVYFIIRDFALSKRKAIKYGNYEKYKKFFVFKINKGWVIAGSVFVLLSFLMAYIIYTNNVLRIYSLEFLMLGVLVLLTGIAYVVSIKYNKDLSSFDVYYANVKNSYINKEKIQENTLILKDKLASFKQELTTIHSNTAALVKNYKQLTALNNCLSPINDKIKFQEGLINSFDSTMTTTFDTSLTNYLKNGKLATNNYSMFNPIINTNEIDDLCQRVKTKEKEVYLQFMLHVFEKQEFVDNDAMIKIAQLLVDNGIFDIKKYLNVLLLNAEKNKENANTIVQFLYKNNFVDFDILKDSVEKEYEFMFDRSVNGLLTEKEIVELICFIIKENKIKVANKYLMFCLKSDYEYIKQAIMVEKTKNDTADLFVGYSELLQLDSGYNNLSTRYEDLALNLRDFYYNTNNERYLNQISNIINQEEYLENKDLLENLYNHSVLSLEPIINKSFQSLLLYYINGKDLISEINSENVLKLYVELKKRLDVRSLQCLTALVDGLMLTHLTDKDILKRVRDNSTKNIKEHNYFDYYPITINRNSNYSLYGKDILENLKQPDNIEYLKMVVMHIESERLLLDKLLKI